MACYVVTGQKPLLLTQYNNYSMEYPIRDQSLVDPGAAKEDR